MQAYKESRLHRRPPKCGGADIQNVAAPARKATSSQPQHRHGSGGQQDRHDPRA